MQFPKKITGTKFIWMSNFK